ncbi:GDP/GTP exchange factor Sec2p [Rhizoctonia solani]|uniref:GDP/GTP exchange factor Sec2p n=1 Tax=Rhizoctonia solani TaxID=456999 RepID=A0A8H7INT5_9AGAM|nr:GDP/GTP exchange factor Sec2p [Rhizoctonia solani]
MQMQMQQMVEARREAEMKVAEMHARIGKGKWAQQDGPLELDGPRRRLYNTHTVYREYVAFISHLRGLRSNAAVIPQLSSLTSLPFIARLIVEDCDPTLRLDLAPALNWLTRRAVHGAILQGQLEIEPVYGLQEAECAMCGSHPNGSLPSSATTSPTTATHALSPKSHTPNGSGSMVAWASSTSKYFKGTLASPGTSPQAHTNGVTQSPVQRIIADPQAPPIYVFRIAGAQAGTGAAPHVLCAGGWCLARLRATCELCAFLKRGVIEKVWSEPPQPLHQGPISSGIRTQQGVLGSVVNAFSGDKDPKDITPPAQPRQRQLSQLGSLWEKGLGAFGGSRTGSRSGTPGPEEEKETPPQLPRRLPPLPAPVPVDTKLSIVPPAPPPPPPPRARPVPPVPSKPEGQETHTDDHEHQEPIQHAMVFDAAADEHASEAPPTSDHLPSPSATVPETQHLAPGGEKEVEEPDTPRPPVISRPPVSVPSPMKKSYIGPCPPTVSPSRLPPRDAGHECIASPSSRIRAGSIRRDIESVRASSPVPSSPAGSGPPKIPRRAPRRAAPCRLVLHRRPSERSTRAKGRREVKPVVEENKIEEEEKLKAEERAAPRPRPPCRASPPGPPLPPRARPPQPVEHHEEVKESEATNTEVKAPEERKPSETKSIAESRHKRKRPAITTLVTSATNDSISHITSIPNTIDDEVGSKRSTEVGAHFVGDDSWEDRAYREIAKLREDMLWARIGSAW